MTRAEYAATKNITTLQLRVLEMAWLECEGYDDVGNEYETLDAWIARRQPQQIIDPIDGGRGVNQYGEVNQ